MFPAEINVQLDGKAIQEHIQKQLDEIIKPSLLLIDAKRLAELLSMSPRYVEEVFLSDPRIKQFEIRKNKKRWYWYKQTIEAIETIVKTEW